MIPAKKLFPETEQEQDRPADSTPEKRGNGFQNVIKLLIIILLAYVIIFM